MRNSGRSRRNFTSLQILTPNIRLSSHSKARFLLIADYQTEWNLFWKTEHEKLSRVTMVGGAEVSKIIEVRQLLRLQKFETVNK